MGRGLMNERVLKMKFILIGVSPAERQRTWLGKRGDMSRIKREMKLV